MTGLPAPVRLTRTHASRVVRARASVSLWAAPRACMRSASSAAPNVPMRRLATAVPTSSPVAAANVGQASPVLPRSETDIAIVGAGPAGLSVACGLAHDLLQSRSPTGVHVSVIEAASLEGLRSFPLRPDGSGDELPWSNRVVSVTAVNMAWLESIGVAPHLVWSRIRALTDMHVSDALAPAGTELHFDAADLSEEDPSTWGAYASVKKPTHVLSYLVEISNLQHAMLAYLASLRPDHVSVTVRDQTKVADIVAYDSGVSTSQPIGSDVSPGADQWPVLTLTPRDGPEQRLATRLLVGADSPRGPVGKYAQIGAFGHQYNRRGLVSTLHCVLPPPPPPGFGGIRVEDVDANPSDPNDPHAGHSGHTAWQRFLPSGPIAFLPLAPDTGSMVWTLPPPICAALEWINRSTRLDTPVDPLAELVSAAFRLPWNLLQPILEAAVVEHRQAVVQQLDGEEDVDAAAQAGRAAVTAIADAVVQAGGLTSLPAYPPGEAVGSSPPPVHKVAQASVASFPLQVRHVDGYTGASLLYAPPSPTTSRSPQQESSLIPPLPIPKPSDLLAATLGVLGVAPEAASKNAARPRTVLVGDAAHSTHPLAGQGLNCGLADAHVLSTTLASAVRGGADIGSGTALAPYPAARYAANQIMLSAADHIHWLYSIGGARPLPRFGFGAEAEQASEAESGFRQAVLGLVSDAVTYARGAGMDLLNEVAPVKRLLMQNAGGGRATRSKPVNKP